MSQHRKPYTVLLLLPEERWVEHAKDNVTLVQVIAEGPKEAVKRAQLKLAEQYEGDFRPSDFEFVIMFDGEVSSISPS